MIAAEEIGTTNYEGLQSVTMHELGHALSIGWADDTSIEIDVGIGSINTIDKGLEIYSGDVDGTYSQPDDTPEYIDTGGVDLTPEWSIMMRGEAADTRDFTTTTAKHPVFAFSIEELSTVDFRAVPAREE